eukprot:TRINITY_DN79686_c0_g1_i1.p1 TRINITY_DN79686_c0_g1~~TRINITY_DN79686_c0_g1_i1.p1  ORF type:complete len:315 (-),score=71.06 TRINITY_DN79686_c0_g1_i1:130-1074(-)
MNKNKALLDSLMGPGRDISKKDKRNSEPEFKGEGVCKDYLVGYCPHKALGKLIKSYRAEFDRESIIQPCTKLHSIGLKQEFLAHKDYEKYKRKYEESLARFLEKAVDEVEAKVAHEKRKVQELGIAENPETPLCEVCGVKYKRQKNDVNLRDRDGHFAPDKHPDDPIHKAWLALRTRCQEMNDAIREREEREFKEKEEKAKKRQEEGSDDEKSGRSKSRRKAKSGSRDESRSPSPKKKKGGKDRDRSRSRSRSGGKDRRDRSRSRQDRSRSRRGGKDRGGGRDRSREDRRGGRDRSRDDRRKRSDSRGGRGRRR